MDSIKRFLGIAPDGGDSLEVLLLVVLVTLLAAIGLYLAGIGKIK